MPTLEKYICQPVLYEKEIKGLLLELTVNFLHTEAKDKMNKGVVVYLTETRKH